jgi:hypothetical protein
MPGASAVPGTPVAYTGTDILLVVSGLLTEYWHNSDVHVMAVTVFEVGALVADCRPGCCDTTQPIMMR